jgi:hypothetical protein
MFFVSLLFLYFVRLGAFLALDYLKAYLVALINRDTRLQTSCMDKIVLSIVARYKSKALDTVEKLHCSIYHFRFSNICSSMAFLYLKLLAICFIFC